MIAGLTGGARGAAACALLLWSGSGAHEVLIEWTRVADAESAEALAAAVNDVPRIVRAGATAIGEALLACEALLKLLPAQASRRVIDMVGDGASNQGVFPARSATGWWPTG